MPQIKKYVNEFAQSWTSHSHQMRAHGDVLHGQFVVLTADESQVDAGGCSIDTSVQFIQQLGQAYDVDLLDRMCFAWMENGKVKAASSEEFAKLYAAGEITDETLVFDNLVKTKGELDEKWLKPLNESWHRRFV